MELTGLKDNDGRDVTLVISDEGHPHHHVLRVIGTSAPEEKLMRFKVGDWVTLFGCIRKITSIRNQKYFLEYGYEGKKTYEGMSGFTEDEMSDERLATQEEIDKVLHPKKPLPKTKEELLDHWQEYLDNENYGCFAYFIHENYED